MYLIELTVGWSLLTAVVALISFRFLYLYFKDRDRRKLMFGTVFAVSVILFLLIVANYSTDSEIPQMKSVQMWVSLINILAIAVAVNEIFFGSRYFGWMFKGWAILSILSLPIALMPSHLAYLMSFRYILGAETLLVLVYLLIKKPNISTLFFLASIVFFSSAGIILANGMQYLSIFLFLPSYGFLAAIFLIQPKSSSSNDKLASYFNLRQQLARTKTALQESQEKFRTIFENCYDAIVYLDLHGNIRDVNRRIEEITGFTMQEVIGRHFTEAGFFSPRQIPDLINGFSRIIGEGDSHIVEMEAIHKNGSQIYLESSCRLIQNDSQAQGIVCILREITARKQADKLRTRFLHDNPSPMLRLANSGTILFANEASQPLLDLWGIREGEAVPESIRALAVEAASGGPCGNAEVQCGGRIFSLTLLPAMAEEQVNLYGRDITDARHAEDQYRLLAENSADIIFRIQMDDTFNYASPSIERLLGYTPQEILTKKTSSILTAESYQYQKDRMASDLAAGLTSATLELEGLHKDGRVIPIESHASIIFGENGQPQEIIGVVRDISERKQAEQVLREKEEFSRKLLEYAPSPISVVNHDTSIRYVNPAFEKLLGFKLEDIAGIQAPYPWWPKGKMSERDAAVRSSEQKDYQLTEQIIQTRDGKLLTVELSIVCVAEGEKPGYYLAHWNDVTERSRFRKKLESTLEKLARSNAELEQFAYIASHDLQEPLRMVSSYVQLLSQRYKDKLDSDADDFINYAVEGSTRMRNLINDLLAYSRVGTRGKPFETVSSEEALKEAMENLNLAITEKGAAVTHDPLPMVKADMSQIVQLFQNLIANAIKFNGGKTPCVHISAEEQAEQWVFCVRDNGIGIDPEHFERIFKIFQRLNNRADYPGTGIGLAVCKRIVERHGGKIWLESEQGQGTAFFFSVPVIQEVKVYA